MDTNISGKHSFEEYHEKYGKKFDKGKLEFVAFKNKKKLNNKKKYWKIWKDKPSNEYKQGFYEITNKNYLVPLLIFFSIAILTTGVVLPVCLLQQNHDNPPSPTEDEITIDTLNKSIEGIDYDTCYDAVIDIRAKTDLDLEKATPKDTTKEFVFDLKRDIVCLLDKDTDLVVYPSAPAHKSDVWKFKNQYQATPNIESAIEIYSTYLKSDFNINSADIIFNSGIDVGENQHLNLKFNSNGVNNPMNLFLNASNEQYEPLVRTSYGDLEIDGPLESVDHYGIAQTLTVTSFDFTYYEYGSILGNVRLKDGTIYVGENAAVNTIIVSNPGAEIIIGSNDGKDGQGIGSIVAEKDCGVDDLTEIYKYEDESKTKNKPDIVETPITEPTEDDLSGLGSEKSPFIISNVEDFSKINNHHYEDRDVDYNPEEGRGFYHYVYRGSEKEIDASNWAYKGKNIWLTGSFDGNGLVLNNLDNPLFKYLGAAHDNQEKEEIPEHCHTIKNITLNCDMNINGTTAALARTFGHYCNFENINIHGYVASSAGVASFCAFGPNNFDEVGAFDKWPAAHVNFKNCHSDAVLITASDQAVGFIKHPYSHCTNSLFTFEDSLFNGTIINTTKTEGYGIDYGYFVGYSQNFTRAKTIYSDSFIVKYGNPEGVYYQEVNRDIKPEDPTFLIGLHNESKGENYCLENYLGEKQQTSYNKADNPGELENFTTKKVENAQVATVALHVGPNYKETESGNYVACFFYETIDLSNVEPDEDFSTKNVKNFIIRINDPSTSELEPGHKITDERYLDIYDQNAFYGKTYSSEYVTIAQWNGNTLLQVTQFIIK